MTRNLKPIKRSTHLAPLSREHHEGLTFVWKIRQGIKKEVQPERIVAYVQWFWLNQLEPHFRKEENVLLPHLNNMEDLRKRLLQEHAHIADSISVVIHNMYWETLENLAYDLNAHIRWEERVLFNHIEQMLTEEKLITLGKALAEQKNCGVWEDSFW